MLTTKTRLANRQPTIINYSDKRYQLPAWNAEIQLIFFNLRYPIIFHSEFYLQNIAPQLFFFSVSRYQYLETYGEIWFIYLIKFL